MFNQMNRGFIMLFIHTQHQIQAICLFWLLSLAFSGQGCSTNESSTLGLKPLETPRISLDKVVYELGRISPGSNCMAVFRLTNVGGGPLVITDVRRCCGAVVKLDRTVLAPGQDGLLTIEYRASAIPGPLTKRIGLLTNDPQQRQVELTIAGQIVRTLAWTPSHLELSASRPTASCPEITLKSLDGMAFSIKGFSATNGCFVVDYDPAHQAREFVLKPRVDKARLQTFTTSNGIIRVYLEHPDYEAIDVPFSVMPALQAVPPQILVFNAKADEPLVQQLQLLDNQADPNAPTGVLIQSVTSKNDRRVELRRVNVNKTGCEISLGIWPAGPKADESFSTDELIIKTKDGRELAVPVRIFYQSPQLSSAARPDPKL